MENKNRQGTGLIHLYSGDGKGKTSAAMGLCVRAAGAGYRVLICQFMKDNSSAERRSMEKIPEITFLDAHESVKFSFCMSSEEKQQEKAFCGALFEDAVREAQEGGYDVLLLDEALYAVRKGFLEESRIVSFLETKPDGLEVILTGQDPGEALISLCDYHSVIRKEKHPFDHNQKARRGIEY